MNDLLISALERLLDWADNPRQYVRDDGSFDWSAAMRDWRRLRTDTKTVLLAAMEDPR